MPANRLTERRMVLGEVETRSKGGQHYMEGYASVFNSRSGNLGGFVEVVKPTAFNKSMKENDVRALFNHDPNYLLGRNRSGTLELSRDDKGLYYRALLPNTSYARDLVELFERRDVTQSSFTFYKITDSWELVDMDDGNSEFPQRSLIEVGLVDVSPVVYPAYEEATSGLARRAAFDTLSKRCGLDIERANEDEITRAIRKLQEPGESTQSRDNAPESQKTTPVDEEVRVSVPSGLTKEEIERQFREELEKFSF